MIVKTHIILLKSAKKNCLFFAFFFFFLTLRSGTTGQMFRTKSNLKIQKIMKYSKEDKIELALCVLYTLSILALVYVSCLVFDRLC